MKRFLLLIFLSNSFFAGICQVETDIPASQSGRIAAPLSGKDLMIEKLNPSTGIKDQGQTGTCWCFSTTSLLESEFLKSNSRALDLSEMFTVRNIYLEKAKNYFLRQGHAQLSEGGLGHDVIRAVSLYGAMPENVFPGLPQGQKAFNHQQLITDLKSYMDSLIARNSRGIIEKRWQAKLIRILNTYIGTPPAEFTYDGKQYTPKTFATDYLKFNAKDYVNITSFTDHSYYEPFIISVPDNFSNGAYYNVPLNEMTDVTKNALKSGYTVLWDADVSNPGFSQKSGTAFNTRLSSENADSIPPAKESGVTAETRQELYENLTTQDDHLMHIIGLEKDKSGKSFFLVKNSWGAAGPYKGYINVSEAYFSLNTISLVIPKAALSRSLLDKLQIK